MTVRPRVVLDVNILVSGFLKGDGAPVQIVDRWRAGDVAVFLSADIIENVACVWARPYFLKRADDIDRSLAVTLMHEQAEHVQPDESVTGVADDAEDDRVLGTAVAANPDYLVTGDRGLLRVRAYRDVRIVSARAFLVLLDS